MNTYTLNAYMMQSTRRARQEYITTQYPQTPASAHDNIMEWEWCDSRVYKAKLQSKSWKIGVNIYVFVRITLCTFLTSSVTSATLTETSSARSASLLAALHGAQYCCGQGQCAINCWSTICAWKRKAYAQVFTNNTKRTKMTGRALHPCSKKQVQGPKNDRCIDNSTW